MDLKWKVKIYGRDKGKFDLKNNRTEMKGEKERKKERFMVMFLRCSCAGLFLT